MANKVKAGIALLVVVLIISVIVAMQKIRNDGPRRHDIQIGVILPLTGSAASLGKACQNGIELAIDDVNHTKSAGEPHLKLLIEDDQAAPAKTISAFQKLEVTYAVKSILGPLTSGSTLAVAPLAERSRAVILSPGGSAPAISQAGDYIFRNELSEAYGARRQAELARSVLKYRSVGLLYVNNEYGVGTIRVFRDRFKALGGNIVTDEAFKPGATDFRTALTKIKATVPDAIFVVFQDEIVNIVKQKSELGVNAMVYTTPVFEDPGNLDKLGPLSEGIVYTYYGMCQ